MENKRPETGIAVDASMRSGKKGGKTGVVEWRCVDIASGEELFRSEVYSEGTINIAELLAIYDGVAYLIDSGKEDMMLYSDSQTAIAWAKTKGDVSASLEVNDATLPLWRRVWSYKGWAENDEVMSVIRTRLLKWDTKNWSENPADLGYKSYAKKCFYAVHIGRDIGVYDNWNDCAKQVIGFPGSVFKSFATMGEATNFMMTGR